MKKHHTKPGLFGISFDAVPMSGVIVEFLKIAEVFNKNKYRIYLDLGYEIKADKNNFFKPLDAEKSFFPDWVDLVRILNKPLSNYTPDLIAKITSAFTQNSGDVAQYESAIDEFSSYIADKLIQLWHTLNIHVVIVENGTLPENVIFTHALYKAISIYGHQRGLGKFVIWRDHDLMWSSETSSLKYGKPPYPNIADFTPKRHISYVVLHEVDYLEASKWCPNAELSILKNSFSPFRSFRHNHDADILDLRQRFRQLYNIPYNAYLIARFTRIIPQKRIDRDILLLHYLHELNAMHSHVSPVYLCIAGDTSEDPDESTRLFQLVRKFELDQFVVFTGILKPAGIDIPDDIKSIKNLILASDICSFLTSYDYESFGNPISEAIGFGKPYITSTYERYQHVYDKAGYKGIKLETNRENDGPTSRKFANDVFQLLHDQHKRKSIIEHNLKLMLLTATTKCSLVNKISNLLDIKLN